ncbi:MAG: peptidase C25, partial [Thermoplasmata archaeon]|nr:peptidase C25 [Thermoplasmata archaeon]
MKSTVVFIVGVLLLSSFTASIYGLSTSTTLASIDEQNFTMNIDKNDIRVSYPNGQLSVEIVNVSTFVIGLGKPRLPEIVRVVELPFGVKNVSVNLEANYNESLAVPMATSVSPDPYPADDFYYRVGVGLNKNFEHVTFVSVHWHPVKYSPSANMLYIAETANVTISYEPANDSPFPENSSYDMVIIAPKVFRKALQKFVDYKNSIGIKTLLKTTEDIYKEYNGRDKPEQIKYFIKNAIETYGIRYVLLVGGLKSMIYAKPRDNANEGSKAWYLPVRYNNLYDKPKYPLVDISSDEEEVFDPGCLTDLYYADIYGEGGKFESWDPNDDGIIAAWGKPGVENDTAIDLYPDVLVGRLPCRNVREVVTVVNKIIGYEKNTYNEEWFKKMIVISGDGFLDQHDLDIEWDTTGVPNGEYTLYAQSFTPDGKSGPKDVVHFTLDRTKPTNLTFNHDDHLNPALQNGYPAPPIAEIVSISPGNTLGYDDYTYTPGESEAYCNQFNPWANVSYIDGILTIRGKSYDPEPYG